MSFAKRHPAIVESVALLVMLIVVFGGSVLMVGCAPRPKRTTPVGEPNLPTTTTTSTTTTTTIPVTKVVTQSFTPDPSYPMWHGWVDGVECISIRQGTTCNWADRDVSKEKVEPEG